MKKEVKERYDIIGNEIKKTTNQHTDEGKYDKRWIADLFVKDSNGKAKIIKDLGDTKKKIYVIEINGENYNFSFDTTDSGGKDSRRKVAIPFASKEFRKTTLEGKRVFVINLYRPLIKEGVVDESKRVWLLIDPLEVYASTSFTNETWNDTSRWFKLEDIKDTIDDGEQRINSRHNVYSELNEGIFNLILKKDILNKHNLMVESQKWVEKYLSRKTQESFNKLRAAFRLKLIEEATDNNNLVDSKVQHRGLMIASHIHAVGDIKADKDINKEEKKKQILDTNNGLLIPVGLDKLFDKYYITFNDDWTMILSKEITEDEVKELCGRNIDGKWIQGKGEETLVYLAKHRDKAFKKRDFS